MTTGIGHTEALGLPSRGIRRVRGSIPPPATSSATTCSAASSMSTSGWPRRETPAARECIETQRARLHRRAHWASGPSQASREQAIETETHRAPPDSGSGPQPPLSWQARSGFWRPTAPIGDPDISPSQTFPG